MCGMAPTEVSVGRKPSLHMPVGCVCLSEARRSAASCLAWVRIEAKVRVSVGLEARRSAASARLELVLRDDTL